MSKKYIELQKTLAAKDKELAEYRSEISRLRTRLEDAGIEDIAKGSQTEASALGFFKEMQKQEDVMDRVMTTATDVGRLKQELIASNRKCTKLQEELIKAKRLEERERDNAEKYRKALQQTATEIDRLNKELEASNSNYAKMQGQLAKAKRLKENEEKGAEKYRKELKQSESKNEELECKLQQLKRTISILTNFICVQAANADKDGAASVAMVMQIKPLIFMEEASDQELGLNAIYHVVSEKNRKTVREIDGLVKRVGYLKKSEFEYVKAAAKRALKKIENDKVYPDHGRGLDISCGYFRKCQQFIKTLDITGSAFDPLFDMCYCSDCIARRGEGLYYFRGDPPKDYGIPEGWCRFALKVPESKIDSLNIFEKWHVAFHGTKEETLKHIIDVGALLIPGDYTLGGRKLTVRPGHFEESEKTRKIFLSPTIRYSGLDAYATPSQFTDPLSGDTCNVKVAIQVRVNPTSYKCGPETVGAECQIDPAYPNEELEWFTKERGSVENYGILVNLKVLSRGSRTPSDFGMPVGPYLGPPVYTPSHVVSHVVESRETTSRSTLKRTKYNT